MTIEKRTFAVDGLAVEYRDDDPPRIVGHAAVFNQEADIGKMFRETIEPGTFRESISQDDVRALFNHDPNFVLGRNTAGTLRMAEDARGLAIEIDPPDTQTARDLMVSVKRGDITQMSFAFEALGEEWRFEEGQPDLRILKKVKLYDVSPVTFPAYAGTDVAVRSRDEARKTMASKEQEGGRPVDIFKRRMRLLNAQSVNNH